MTKLNKSIIIILIIQILGWIGFAVWVFLAGTKASGDAAQSAANQGANNGSIVGGAAAGAVVAIFSELAVILITIGVAILVINTIIALIIYAKKKRSSIFGGILTFIFASPIAGILMFVEVGKTKNKSKDL